MNPKKITLITTIILLITLTLGIPASAVTYKYDDLNRLTEVTYSSGQKINYTYDAGGNILSVTSTVYNNPTDNLLSNPGFDNGSNSGWICNADSSAKVNSEIDTDTYDTAPASLKIQCITKGSASSSIQFVTTTPFSITKDREYTLTFRAKATSAFTIPSIQIAQKVSPWVSYSNLRSGTSIATDWNTYSVKFQTTITASDARLAFFLGNSIPEGASLYLDSFSLKDTGVATPAPTPTPTQTPTPTPAGTNELLSNPSFSSDASGWQCNTDTTAQVSASVDSAVYDTAPGGYGIKCMNKGSSSGSIQLVSMVPFSVESGSEYVLTFRAMATSAFTIPFMQVAKRSSPWTNYSVSQSGSAITTSWKSYTLRFTANTTANDARLVFLLGNAIPEGATFYIDTLSLRKSTELLSNTSFSSDTSGWSCNTDSFAQVTASVDSAVYDSAPAGYRIVCTNKGNAIGSVQMLTTVPFSIEKNREYLLTFKAKATSAFNIPMVQLAQRGSPWATYSTTFSNMAVGTGWQSYTVRLTANTTASDARLVFLLGNAIPEGATFYIDTLSLK